MKTTVEAREIAPGVVEPKHEIEVVCAHCSDPVSAVEAASGNCTNCGQPWRAKQSVSIFATSVPYAGGQVLS